MAATQKRIVVAITGATGAIYGIRLLETLRQLQVQTHLVVSPSGWLTLRQECELDRPAVHALADVVHDVRDIGATLASGSFRHDGMVVAPCSMRTLAAVAHGLNDNLITRAADVTLKERRRLVLLAREAPLTLAHLRNMMLATEMGATVMPPVPAFYARPRDIDDLVRHTVWRTLDQLAIGDEDAYRRWGGMQAEMREMRAIGDWR